MSEWYEPYLDQASAGFSGLLQECEARIQAQAQEKVRAIQNWIEVNELACRLLDMLAALQLVRVRSHVVYPGQYGLPGQTRKVRILDEVIAPTWLWRQLDRRKEEGWYDAADPCGFVARYIPPASKQQPDPDLPEPDVTA